MSGRDRADPRERQGGTRPGPNAVHLTLSPCQAEVGESELVTGVCVPLA